MKRTFDVSKGLQKPLVYKGFKGKFIFWGLGFLIGGIIMGAIASSTINTYFGGFVGLAFAVGGIFYTGNRQKGGLYNKPRDRVIYTPPITIQKGLGKVYRSKIYLLDYLKHGKEDSI